MSEMVRGLVSSRTAEQYLKRSESRVTAQAATRNGSGKAAGEDGREGQASRRSKGGKVEQFRE